MVLFSNAFIGQLIVLVFLLFVTLRPLLKKSRNLESLSVFAAIAVCLNILLIFIFGLSFLLIISFCLSLIVLIANIASIYRLVQNLYSDRHSTLFTVVSYIEAALVVVCIGLLFFFMPVTYNTDFQEKELYTGSFARGFSQKTSFVDKTNLIITEYSATHLNIYSSSIPVLSPEIAVVYISPYGTTSQDAALRLTNAAEMGLNIIAGDFFVLDAPKTGTSLDSSININPVLKPFALHFLPQLQASQKQAFLDQKKLELETLLTIAGQKYSSVIILAEGDNKVIALEAKKNYPNFVLDVFSTTNDAELNAYYAKNIADIVLLNPFDALLSQFSSIRDYNEVFSYANTEKPALRFARYLADHLESFTTEEANDPF